MKKIQFLLARAKNVFVAAAMIVVLAQCTDEEELVQPSQPASEAATSATAAEEVGSLSVQGVYTEIRPSVNCATCTFVVDKNATAVDGKELGLKPGSVICLQTGVRYSSIDFVNMEGSSDSPIVIGYCNN